MTRSSGTHTTLRVRPTYVVDWDGTLTEDAWPEQGEWLPGAVDALRALLERGLVKVHSSRINPYAYGQDGVELRPHNDWLADINDIRKMLDAEGLGEVDIHTTHGKPSGDYYIDNLAVEFKGDWDEVLRRVLPVRQVDPSHNPDYVMGPGDDVPRLATPRERQQLGIVAPDDIPTVDAAIRMFDTGATRDTDTDKLAYEGFFSPLVFQERARYMHKHRVQSDGALRAPDNWQKGIPLEAYIDSGWRHMMDWWLNHRGYKSRESLKEALCALAFNVDGYLHEILKAEA